MLKNTAIIDVLSKGLWKQSSATPYGLCSPKESSWRAVAVACWSRRLQRDYIFAVKLLVLAWLAWCSPLLLMLPVLCPFLHCLYWSKLSVLEELGESTGAADSREQKQKPRWNTSCLLQALQATSRKASVGACSDIPDTWSGLIQMHPFSIIYWPLLAAAVNAQIPLQVEHSQMRW